MGSCGGWERIIERIAIYIQAFPGSPVTSGCSTRRMDIAYICFRVLQLRSVSACDEPRKGMRQEHPGRCKEPPLRECNNTRWNVGCIHVSAHRAHKTNTIDR